MLVADCAHDPRCDPQKVALTGVRAFASIPLRAGDRLVGVLDLAGQHQFPPGLVEALATLGSQFGLVLAGSGTTLRAAHG